jgi:negative regulator of sigma E activity
MTTRNDSHPASDREALSALFDGELIGDAARFALKRLDHDNDWRATCDRWRIAGEALRGQGAALPAGFPSRVRAAMRDEPGAAAAFAPRATGTGGFRWGSVALAASAAAVAFFLARGPMQPDTNGVASPAQIAASQPTPAQPAPQAPLSDTPRVPAMEDATTAAVAVAAVARPSAQRARNLQRDRAATDRIVSTAIASTTASLTPASASDAPITGEAPSTLLVSSQSSPDAPSLATPASPFASPVESRPWPRAVLPQLSGNGTLAADYATTPSFYPFAPRVTDTAPANEPAPAPTP